MKDDAETDRCTDGTEHETHPDLDAWKITSDGETDRIIVGKWFNSPKRIEVDPSDLITDPDARSLSTESDRSD